MRHPAPAAEGTLPPSPRPPGRRPRWLLPSLAALFAFGLLVSVVMVARFQVEEDQLHLLARGWLLVEKGDWV